MSKKTKKTTQSEKVKVTQPQYDCADKDTINLSVWHLLLIAVVTAVIVAAVF